MNANIPNRWTPDAGELSLMREARRRLHAHPELSGQEEKTTDYLEERLKEMGLSPRRFAEGYGLTALVTGEKAADGRREATGREDPTVTRDPAAGPCAALRADIDALPVTEQTGLPFRSEKEGIMHACGHDMHTAILLGAAQLLVRNRDAFSGTVKLIFQPSEEDSFASGARSIIRQGVLKAPDVGAIFGLHLWPSWETGQIGFRPGAITASSDRFILTVRGKSSHASSPQNGIDAVVIAAQIVTALQTVVSRSSDPFDTVVVSIGTIHGGQRHNVIADEVVMTGTYRTLRPELREEVPERIRHIASAAAHSLGGSCECECRRGYSSTMNDPGLYPMAADILRADDFPGTLYPMERASMIGEDFSAYTELIPGAFFLLGCRNPGTPAEGAPFLHDPALSPDENCLAVGAELLSRCAVKWLVQHS